MELTLNIDDQTARKIKALSVLSEYSASEITSLISTRIDTIITNEILSILGVEKDFDFGPHKGVSVPDLDVDTSIPVKVLEIDDEDEIMAQNDDDSDETDEDSYEGPTVFGVADSMGHKIEDIKEELLPKEMQEELQDMAVKSKNGEETGYEDEIMADAQAMAESEFGNQDDVIAAAAGSLGSASKDFSYTGDDSPKEEGGIPSSTPDVLPVDLGIESASSDDGGMAFFGGVISGQKGDKTARNKVTRKRRKK